jgi:hypothetical protein
MASTDSKRLKAANKARRKAAKANRKRGPIVGVNQLSPRDFQRWKNGKI